MPRTSTLSRLRGLTLIEVLVALALWGLMTALLTQGLDVVTRSQRQQIARSDAHARLQTSLAQWQTDLDQIDAESGLPYVMDWNGQVLRLVRHSPPPHAGQRTVVAWALMGGRWVRWQSGPIQTRIDLAAAWQQALQAVVLAGEQVPNNEWVSAQGWQLFFFYQDSWSNALSSRGAGPSLGGGIQATSNPISPGSDSVLPDAVRLQLDLTPQGDWQGRLQWDWVRPSWSVTRS
jgi:general secretion pathway protein J